MRVVETVSGGGAGVHGSTITTATSNVPVAATVKASPAPIAPNSIQAIGLRTVSGQTVVPPQTQQTPSPASFANSPSPLCGTVAAVSVTSSSHQQQLHRPQLQQQVRSSTQVLPMSTPTSNSTPVSSVPTPHISGFQVLHPHTTSSSLSLSPASPQTPVRSSSPGPTITHIAQLQQGKTSNCLPLSGPLNSSSIGTSNQNHATTTPAGGLVNNIDHGKSGGNVPGAGALPQVSSQSLTQQVFYTPAYIKAGENLSEEAWTRDWLNGGFEQLTGTSIEVGELYRMYCISRTRHYTNTLTQAELINCVQ